MFLHRLCSVACAGSLLLAQTVPSFGAEDGPRLSGMPAAESAAPLPVSAGAVLPPENLDADPRARMHTTRGAASVSYTMEEAVRLALEANPGVESERRSLDAAESARKAARGNFGPTVSSSYSYTRYDKERLARNERNAYTWGVTASQPLFAGFRLLYSYQKAALQRDSRALQLENTRLGIAGQVQAQFLAYLTARENIRSTQRSLERARAQLALARAAYDVGVRPHLDVLQAELDVSRTEATLIRGENNLEICRAQLNTLLNLPVDAPVEYVGDLDPVPFGLGLEQCLEQAFRQRPDLRMARKAVEMAEKDGGISRSAFYPQLDASLNWNTTGRDARAAGNKFSSTDYSQWQVGVTARWTLFDSGARWYGTRQAKSQIAALEAQMQAAFNSSAYEVKSCLLNAQDARRMIAVAERSVVSARESYDDARMRYDLQLGTNLDLLTAQSDLASAELALISARSDYLTALSRLYVAMGEIRPDLRS